ncbi:hypothetical protein BT69DRAFT_1330646 [Atractiella rhizophila]|nr:hypothetical protein BT69DRAFT_1330646 [Atractiella rhizophila]
MPQLATSYGGNWQFLTVLGLTATWIVFALSLIPSKLAANLRASLQEVVIPVELLISFLWYSLTLFFPQLMLPPSLLQNRNTIFLLPPKFDLSIHFLPALVLLLSPPPPSDSARSNPWLSAAALTVAYTAWMEKCASVNGWFPYPFLDLMSLSQRCLMYVGCALVTGAFGELAAWARASGKWRVKQVE